MAAVVGLLAVALLAGAYLLVSVLALFYLALLGLTVWAIAEGTFQITFVWLLIGGGLVLVALVRALFTSSGGAPEPGAVAVSHKRAPGLWALVEDLAERVGTRVPAELYLTADANAAVSEASRALGLLPGRRRLYVGIPLLLGLSGGELRAVLCHELGHYARGHTRLGAVTYRGSAALAGARRALARAALANQFARWYGGVPFGLLSAYAWVYDLISLAVRRRQEYHADAQAARIAGRQTTASALTSVQGLAVAWTDFNTRFLEPMHRQGLAPDDAFSAFQVMITDPDYLDMPVWHPSPRPAMVRDSHPSLKQRLAALDRLPDTASPDLPSPLDLIPDPEGIFRTVNRRDQLRGPRPMPWRNWVLAIANQHAAEELAELRTAVNRVRDTKSAALTVGAVLDLLEAGHRSRLEAALTGPLHAAVFTLMGQALVQAGSASWTVPWTGVRHLIPVDGTSDELRDLVRAAVDRPTEVARLRSPLATSNVDIEAGVLCSVETASTITTRRD
jgi:Zn-dependent protease with chaperone function